MQTVVQRKRDNPEYNSWAGMRQRCNNPSNKDYGRYGGRGITVCERWNDFVLFLKDMGERPTTKHTIDRVDNDKGYSPKNCRWSTKKEQTHNSRVVKIDYQDVLEIRRFYSRGVITQTKLALYYGVDQSVISRIINNKIW